MKVDPDGGKDKMSAKESNDMENFELEEKEKTVGEKDQLLNDEEKEGKQKEESDDILKESPMNEAFCISKYITFW